MTQKHHIPDTPSGDIATTSHLRLVTTRLNTLNTPRRYCFNTHTTIDALWLDYLHMKQWEFLTLSFKQKYKPIFLFASHWLTHPQRNWHFVYSNSTTACRYYDESITAWQVRTSSPQSPYGHPDRLARITTQRHIEGCCSSTTLYHSSTQALTTRTLYLSTWVFLQHTSKVFTSPTMLSSHMKIINSPLLWSSGRLNYTIIISHQAYQQWESQLSRML